MIKHTHVCFKRKTVFVSAFGFGVYTAEVGDIVPIQTASTSAPPAIMVGDVHIWAKEDETRSDPRIELLSLDDNAARMLAVELSMREAKWRDVEEGAYAPCSSSVSTNLSPNVERLIAEQEGAHE